MSKYMDPFAPGVARHFKTGETLDAEVGKGLLHSIETGDFAVEVCTGKTEESRGRSCQLLQTHRESKDKKTDKKNQKKHQELLTY